MRTAGCYFEPGKRCNNNNGNLMQHILLKSDYDLKVLNLWIFNDLLVEGVVAGTGRASFGENSQDEDRLTDISSMATSLPQNPVPAIPSKMIYRVKKKDAYITLRIKHILQLALSLQIIISTGPELAGNIYASCRLFMSHQTFSGAPCARLSVSPHLKKCGNLPIREILVITWPYVRPSAPQAYQCKITQSTGMATQMQLEGAGEGPAKEKIIFPSPSFCPCTCSKGCYLYSLESSSDIKPKMAASTVRT